MDLLTELKKLRPTLSDGSLKTYTSILRSLHSKIFGGNINKSDFDETDKILKHLDDLPPNRRKTILSALVVISGKPDYRTEMLEDIKSYSNDSKKMEKSDSQSENWVSKIEILNLYNQHKQDALSCYKKSKLNMSDLQTIQNYIILSLLGGMFIAPRRSLDYTEFKIKNINKEDDNYLEKHELIFNRYKTAKFYNEQRVAISKELLSILKKWIKTNNVSEYLLFDSNGQKLTSVKLNQRLNKIFQKNCSINILRHVYLTDRFGDEIERSKKMLAVAEDMGTSSAQVIGTYIKKE
jgi:integrase